MNTKDVYSKVLLYFLMLMFLAITVGCSSSDDAPPAATTTYTISGAMTGDVTADVNINLTGAATSSTKTAADGTYSFAGLANGTYEVKPVLEGYTFNPTSKVVVINGSDMVVDFVSTSASEVYTVSGMVTGAANVTINLSGDTTGSALTGASGENYTITNLAAGNYTLTPYLSGYSFDPGSANVTLGPNAAGVNFTATAANFTQADLTGTWNLQFLKSGAATNGWERVTLTIDGNGKAACVSYANSSGAASCPGSVDLTIAIDGDGVITESGTNSSEISHMTMASNKTFIAGTATESGSFRMLIGQKAVAGTSYSNNDLASKNFVTHSLSVGNSNKWQHEIGYTNGAGAVYITSSTDPSGTNTNLENTGVTVSVDASGVVSMTGGDMGTYEGFMSADKKTIVGTFSDDGATSYKLMIIQITDGQSSSTSQIAGTSYGHSLNVGASPAPFWYHQTITATSGGILSFSDWVCSNGSVTGPTGTVTMSIGSSGTATVTPPSGTSDFHGQLSYDGTFMVGTETYDTSVYGLDVITH